MTLEEAKKILKNESKYNESLNKTTNELLENENLHYKNEPYVSSFEIDIHRRAKVNQAIDTVLKALEEYEKQMDLDYVRDNYILKEKIRNELRKLQDNNLNFKDSIVFNCIKELIGE